MNNLWKGIAIASIMACNIGIAVYAKEAVVFTMMFSMVMVGVIAES